MTGRRDVPQAPRRRGVAAPEQESGQREENRDRQIESAEQPTVDPAGMPGLERSVGDHHSDGSAGTHALDGGQEVAGAADR